jgi:hypothetical protein
MSGPELAAEAIANIAPSAVIAFTAASSRDGTLDDRLVVTVTPRRP